MAESKTVDGAVEELLLGDGFSIVDSTNTTTATKSEANNDVESKKSPPKEDGNNPTTGETKKSESTTATKKPLVEEKSAAAVKKEEEKKPEPVKKAAAAAATTTAAAEPKRGEVKDDKKTDVVEPEAKEEKLNGHGSNVEKSDSLLITTEEDLELDKKPESETKDDDDAKKKEKDKDSKKKTNGDVWVSNITRHIKATDVKKHFSRHGKVLTAKIVTNGRSFFGYILMETPEIANKCVKTLHGTLLEGRKISVSRSRPDSQRRTDRKSDVSSRNVKKPSEKTASTTGEKKADDSKDRKKESSDKKTTVDKKETDLIISDLRRTQRKLHMEVDFHKREIIRLKRFLQEEKQKVRAEQGRCRGLQSDLEEAENKLRSERRKMERERDIAEKTARSDRVKLESDRTMMKKELEEVKKLREYLKRKIEEDQARASARVEPPPPRRTRASSPPYAYSSKRFREDPDKSSSSKYEERTRTPPSPPKLSSSSSSRKRSSPMVGFVEKERTSSRHYDGSGGSYEKESRHGSMVMSSKPSAPAPPRNIWPSPFHQEVWRMGPSAATSASPFSSAQFTRPSDYSQGSSSKGPAAYSSQSSSSREYSKRDHYSSSSVRKY